MPKPKKPKPGPEPAGVTAVGKVIAQTNHLYLSVGAIGHLNDKGKSIFSSHYKGKMVAKPDRPLSSLGAAVLLLLAEHARYSGPAQAKQDIKELKAFVAGLGWTKKPPEDDKDA